MFFQATSLTVWLHFAKEPHDNKRKTHSVSHKDTTVYNVSATSKARKETKKKIKTPEKKSLNSQQRQQKSDTRRQAALQLAKRVAVVARQLSTNHEGIGRLRASHLSPSGSHRWLLLEPSWLGGLPHGEPLGSHAGLRLKALLLRGTVRGRSCARGRPAKRCKPPSCGVHAEAAILHRELLEAEPSSAGGGSLAEAGRLGGCTKGVGLARHSSASHRHGWS